MFNSRRVRIIVGTIVVLIVALSVWYRVAIAPELTAVDYELWVAGDGSDLEIEVDRAAGLVVVSNVPTGLPDMVLDERTVYVRGDAGLGSDRSGWVSIPLEKVDDRFAALTLGRVQEAIGREVKQCLAMSPDAWRIIELLLAPPSEVRAGGSLCQEAVFVAAEQGETVLVSSKSRRPSGVALDAVAETDLVS